MQVFNNFAAVETPIPTNFWSAMDEPQRMNHVVSKLKNSPVQFLDEIQVVTSELDGQVIVRLKQALSASQRGPLLLDLEGYLKASIDEAITVWLEPVGDRNSLRNLRGIEIKA